MMLPGQPPTTTVHTAQLPRTTHLASSTVGMFRSGGRCAAWKMLFMGGVSSDWKGSEKLARGAKRTARGAGRVERERTETSRSPPDPHRKAAAVEDRAGDLVNMLQTRL